MLARTWDTLLPRTSRRARVLAILGFAALVAVAIVPLAALFLPEEPQDGGLLSELPLSEPTQREVWGARIYMLRQPTGEVLALWGISPVRGGQGNSFQCFIARRSGAQFKGETNLFIDPCQGIWWARDGRFLGYSEQGDATRPPAPDMPRIPTTIRNGRVLIEKAALDCLQSRGVGCR